MNNSVETDGAVSFYPTGLWGNDPLADLLNETWHTYRQGKLDIGVYAVCLCGCFFLRLCRAVGGYRCAAALLFCIGDNIWTGEAYWHCRLRVLCSLLQELSTYCCRASRHHPYPVPCWWWAQDLRGVHIPYAGEAGAIPPWWRRELLARCSYRISIECIHAWQLSPDRAGFWHAFSSNALASGIGYIIWYTHYRH